MGARAAKQGGAAAPPAPPAADPLAKTLSVYRLLLTLILAKSLTVDPYNCRPLNVRMSVIL